MVETFKVSIILIDDGKRVSRRGGVIFDHSKISHSIAVILGPFSGINLIESEVNWSGNTILVEQTPAEEKQLEIVSLQ